MEEFMEPLFTTQFAYTLEEYTKFNIEMTKRQKANKILNIIMALCPVFFGIINYFNYKNITFALIAALITLIFIIIFFAVKPASFKALVKKQYYSDKTLDSNISNYEFFENEFKETDLHGFSKHTYSELTQIIETETNFYLMISNIQGYLISKSNCSPELIEFLQDIKAKYNI